MGGLNKGLGRLAFVLARRFPARRTLGLAARHYADRCEGDNDSDPATNGEHWLLTRLAPGAGVMIDAGANKGDWAEAALRLGPVSLQLHCFEPGQGAFQQLHRRLARRARCIQAALGARTGALRLHLGGPEGTLSSVHRRAGILAGGSEKVRVLTLDTYCRQRGLSRIALVKIDVEGHELAVLQGMQGLLKARAVDHIQFEYGGTYLDAGTRLAGVFRLLQARDYSLAKILPRGLRPCPAFEVAMESFQYSNWLASAPGTFLP